MDIIKIYGSKTFSDEVMREHLPETVYRSLKNTSRLGKPLDPAIADVVAAVMKDWAVQNGATHFTHWFHPLSNVTAGKHDAFLSITREGKVISEFSSSALVRGEPDASSFPSGGLRATFEARGYTAWDPSSPAFIRDGTLYIPTAFCSYSGEALDSKTPLLRAMQALNPQALRVLRALGNTTSQLVIPTVGAEQEYFLIDRQKYEARLDLKLCGRTLVGARPPKGQELEDHYCGRIRLRVAEFMRDLDEQLWALGIPSKTKHNETAPAQHELAPIFETANIACDHNLNMMEVMRITAKRHGLTCLLHEKPFAGINGSGKHNNFSLTTDDGINFLAPGKSPAENKLFLVTLCALIECVDNYADLLRMAAAVPGNEHRLGGGEAPPAIISIFLGTEYTDMLTSIAKGIRPSLRDPAALNTDVAILPRLEKDNSDRNRTSPFAYTGNKFEFRMLGSSQSIAFINTVLSAALADVFSRFAQRLEECSDLETEVAHIVADTIQNHGRILFNGNNYSQEWVEEATRRGLPILNTVEALDALQNPKNIQLFCRTGVLSETECHARHEIFLENYVKVVGVEAETMLYMAQQQILPACVRYMKLLSDSLNSLEQAGVKNETLKQRLTALSEQVELLVQRCDDLLAACHKDRKADLRKRAGAMQTEVRARMEQLRESCDTLETMVGAEYWPMPTYTDLLHRI
jgi:glutamine synthetase